MDQMQQISNNINSILIQGNVGRRSKSFSISNLPSLITLEMGCVAFCDCRWIVFESMNDWMNDEWDLAQLQSITLGLWALCGDKDNVESNELIMKSMNDNDWLMRSSFSIYT